MQFKPVQILFFVDGMAPTNQDLIDAAAINAHVMFRNARAVPAEGALEKCDGVAGKVPPRYAKAYPTAEAAVEKRAKEIAALSAKVGDSPAPAIPPAQPTGSAQADGTAADAQQTAQGAADAGGAGDATADAAKPAPGAAPVGSMGSAWKAN